MKQILILEDNIPILERLKAVAQGFDARVFAVTDLAEAYRIAFEFSIDVFLLDIILSPQNQGDASGVRFAMAIRQIERYKQASMIFVTCMEDPSMTLFKDLHCFKRIEKPFSDIQIRNALREALNLPDVEMCPPTYINFRVKRLNIIKKVEDIIYIEKKERIPHVYTVDGSFPAQYMTMQEILDELSGTRFCRCSRYTVVNIDYIEAVDVINQFIILQDNRGVLELGSKYRNSFLKACGDV